MIKRLRYKFIALALTAVLSVITIIVIFTNVTIESDLFSDVDTEIAKLYNFASQTEDIYNWYGSLPVEQNGIFTKTTAADESVTFFVIHRSSSGTLSEEDIHSIPGITPEYAQELILTAMNSYSLSGNADIFRFGIFEEADGSQTIIFLNAESSLHFFHKLLRSSLLVSLLSFLIAAVSVAALSNTVVSSTAEAIDRQKQFITNAGHDLKTPIAVISANMDVLSLKDRENQWILSTKKQAAKLKRLVNDLIDISTLNEDSYNLQFESFNLSGAVEETAKQFADLAEFRGLIYSQHIEPELFFYGNESYIRRLVTILCENAVKYSNDNGEIQISLSSHRGKLYLSVLNTCEDTASLELDKLFDRFYRGDKSRSSENGGNGIGLAMASAIVDAHDGEISAHCEGPNSIIFNVVLKAK